MARPPETRADTHTTVRTPIAGRPHRHDPSNIIKVITIIIIICARRGAASTDPEHILRGPTVRAQRLTWIHAQFWNAHTDQKIAHCGSHGGHETVEVRYVLRTIGGRGLYGGGAEKRVVGVFPGRPQSFWYQRRPVDDCSPGQGGITQDGGTRGGAFYGERDHCRECQG